MKYAISIILSLALFSSLHAQSRNDPEQTIRRMLETGMYQGWDSKVLGPMGDAAAVVLTRVLAGRALSQDDIDTSLVILEQSFGDPGMVENVADRAPRTALFVLTSLSARTTDPSVKKRISETSQHIQERYAKSIGTKSQE